jgi:hypothetical protein
MHESIAGVIPDRMDGEIAHQAGSMLAEYLLDPCADLVRKAGTRKDCPGLDMLDDLAQSAPHEVDLAEVAAAGDAVEEMSLQGNPFQTAQVALARR